MMMMISAETPVKVVERATGVKVQDIMNNTKHPPYKILHRRAILPAGGSSH